MNLKRFEPYFDIVKKTIYKKVKNNQDVDDIFQDIIIYLWCKPEIDIIYPKTFIYNATKWYISKYKYNNDLNIDDLNENNIDNSSGVIFNSEIGWNINEIDDNLYNKLKTCPKKLLEPFIHQILNDMSIKDISIELNMNENTVKTNIKRAKIYLNS